MKYHQHNEGEYPHSISFAMPKSRVDAKANSLRHTLIANLPANFRCLKAEDAICIPCISVNMANDDYDGWLKKHCSHPFFMFTEASNPMHTGTVYDVVVAFQNKADAMLFKLANQ